MSETSLLVKITLFGFIVLLGLFIAAYHVVFDPRRRAKTPARGADEVKVADERTREGAAKAA